MSNVRLGWPAGVTSMLSGTIFLLDWEAENVGALFQIRPADLYKLVQIT